MIHMNGWQISPGSGVIAAVLLWAVIWFLVQSFTPQ
jgi:hypothetical protein